jgi:hypothetical protein
MHGWLEFDQRERAGALPRGLPFLSVPTGTPDQRAEVLKCTKTFSDSADVH